MEPTAIRGCVCDRSNNASLTPFLEVLLFGPWDFTGVLLAIRENSVCMRINDSERGVVRGGFLWFVRRLH